jgi:addiction module HigA family antidote
VLLRHCINIVIKQLLIVIILEKRALSADMAVRIARLTNTTPENWLRVQEALDLRGLAQDPKRCRHIEPVAA